MPLVLAALVGLALAKGPPAVSVFKEKADLDGDGKPDKVEVLTSVGQDGLKSVKVTVNGVSVADQQMYETVSASLVDVNTADKTRHVLVEGTSKGGRKWFTLFAWTGRKVVQAMKADTGSPQGAFHPIDGGQIVVDLPHDFWTEHALWTEMGGSFSVVTQPFVAVGAPATVTAPLSLVVSPGDATPITALPAGAAVDIVLCNDPKKPWFLVRTSNGVLGWVDGHEVGQSLKPGAATAEASGG